MNAPIPSSVRFILVGGINTIIGLLVIWLLKWAGQMGDTAANFGGYIVGLMASFVLNRNWTFNYSGAWLPSALRFCWVFAVAYLANLTVVLLLVRRFGADGYIAQMLGIPPYVIVFYLGSRFFAFRT